jgi:hypothetical protein
MDEAQHVVGDPRGEPRERVVARSDARRELEGLETERAEALFEIADQAGEERFVVGEDECDERDFPLRTKRRRDAASEADITAPRSTNPLLYEPFRGFPRLR